MNTIVVFVRTPVNHAEKLPLMTGCHGFVTEYGQYGMANTRNETEKQQMECEDFLEPPQDHEYDDDQ